jgi:RimJ/RimL family protein N-acetyltransferase
MEPTMLLRTPDFLLQEAPCPVLATERLVLRKPVHGDAAAITQLVNDRRVAENLRRVPHPFAEADADDFIVHVGTGRDRVFLVTLGNSPVGMIGVDFGKPERPELGYWLGADFWGFGYATEAARAVIDLAFGTTGIDQIFASARVVNPASRHVLEKCGFQWRGVELHRYRSLGSSTPVDCFCLDRRVWSSLKAWANAVPA